MQIMEMGLHHNQSLSLARLERSSSSIGLYFSFEASISGFKDAGRDFILIIGEYKF